MTRRTMLVLFCGLLALFAFPGCRPEHREVGFSPEGKYIALISDAKDHSESAIMVRRVDAEGQRPSPVYTAPKGMKVYDIFWKGDSLVFFESGEEWACGEKPEKQPPDPMPQFQVRVARFTLINNNPEPGEVQTLISKSFDCWIPTSKSGSDFVRNSRLARVHITDAKHGDTLVLNNILQDSSGDLFGFLLIDARTGEARPIMNGRTVSDPVLSPDGAMLAFSETFEIPVLDAPGTEAQTQTRSQLLVTPLPKIKEKIISAPEWVAGKFWTRDNRFLFVNTELPATVECKRESAENDDAKPVSGEEQLRNGQCRKIHDIVPESQQYHEMFNYFPDSYPVVFKADVSKGTAVLWKQDAQISHILPDSDEILYTQKHYTADDEYLIADYSGTVLRSASDWDMADFQDTSPQGVKADSLPFSGMKLLRSPDRSDEEVLIARDEDLLSAGRYFYQFKNFESSSRYFDEYIKATGPLENIMDKLFAFDAYRHAGRMDQARAMAAAIPRPCLMSFAIQNAAGIPYWFHRDQCD